MRLKEEGQLHRKKLHSLYIQHGCSVHSTQQHSSRGDMINGIFTVSQPGRGIPYARNIPLASSLFLQAGRHS